MRTKRRNSERPWSVSCLSQLTQADTSNRSDEQINNQGLANHSISESALHTLSAPIAVSSSSASASANAVNTSSMKSADSKNSLKRRRMRARKRLGVSLFRDSVSKHTNFVFIYISRVVKVKQTLIQTAEHSRNYLASSLLH